MAARTAQVDVHLGMLKTSLRSAGDWNDADRLGAALARVIHATSHLGAIRQGIRSLG